MEDRRSGAPNISWTAVAAVIAAAAGGWLWFQAPLTSSRPAGQHEHEHLLLGDQDVESRLWQDPFAAVFHHEHAEEAKDQVKADREKKETHLIKNLAEQIARAATALAPDEMVRILPVMVSGGPYGEDAESRLRSRQAVISALGVAGYKPDDAENIGYFEMAWPAGKEILSSERKRAGRASAATKNEDGLSLDVPFEWFSPRKFEPPAENSARTKRVLVLWLKEEALADLPLLRLARLIQTIKDEVKTSGGATDRLKISILGPRSSSTLQSMLPEYGTSNVTPVNLSNVTMYSSSATTMDGFLIKGAAGERRAAVAQTLKAHGLAFISTVCTDDQLAEQLVQELGRRGVNLRGTNDCVALVSEWDTLYGRVLPMTFGVEVIRQQGARQLGPDSNHFRSEVLEALRTRQAKDPDTIRHFDYLRGIDGKLPSDEPSQQPAEKEKANDKPKGTEELERPEGQNQLDYIPRLAGRLHAWDAQLRQQGKQLKAIGVLGSDVYDKLLVLQTLHDRFPGVIFFTTDLDARLWHPRQLKWSRNLVIASSFGLELHESIQGAISPFRDSYQTGLFFTCLRLLGDPRTTNLVSFAPRLYEIGLHGAYDLSVDPAPEQSALTTTPPAALHPARANPLGWWSPRRYWLAVGVIVSTLLLLFWLSRVQSASSYLDLRRIRSFALLYLSVVAGLWAAAWWLFRGYHWPVEEPWVFFEGISIWPTEIVRIVAAILSCHLLMKACLDLRENTQKLQLDFQLTSTEMPTRFWARLEKWWHHPVQRWRALMGECREWWTKCWLDRDVTPALFDSAEDAQGWWSAYLKRGSLWNRACRIVLVAVFYFLFSACLIGLFPKPVVPFRGAASYHIDLFARYFSLVLLLLLMFFVADATRLCVWFINRLTEKPREWPDNCLKARAAQRAMRPDDLGGWLDIQLIARRSDAVGRLILYPFLVLFLLIVARNSYFDDWSWPLSVILIFAMNSAYALVCAVGLRRAAENARTKVLGKLNEMLLQALAKEGPDAGSPPGQPDRVEQIRATINEVESIDKGAFAPLSQHPLIGAILMPSGGVGVLSLLEYFAIPR